MNRRPLSLAICLLVPFLILVVGLSVAGWEGYRASLDLRKENGRGVVPPGFAVEVEEAGKHTIWLHTFTVFEGAAYESAERLAPGAKLLLIDEATGDSIDVTSFGSASKSLGSERSVSLGTFDLLKPARISVRATGLPDPVVLSIAPAKLADVVRTIVRVGVIAGLSLFGAILALVVLLHRRQKSMEAEAQMHHP